MSFRPVDESFSSINYELENVLKILQEKTIELAVSRENYLKAKIFAEKEYSRFLLESKAKNPDMVQSEIKAQAKVLSYDSKLESVKFQSSYMKIFNELKVLRDQLDMLYEHSYNLRSETRLK